MNLCTLFIIITCSSSRPHRENLKGTQFFFEQIMCLLSDSGVGMDKQVKYQLKFDKLLFNFILYNISLSIILCISLNQSMYISIYIYIFFQSICLSIYFSVELTWIFCLFHLLVFHVEEYWSDRPDRIKTDRLWQLCHSSNRTLYHIYNAFRSVIWCKLNYF